MSLYQLQKLLYNLNRDDRVKAQYAENLDALLAEYDLSEPESEALREGDVGLLYVFGVNGQILMHYAAHLGCLLYTSPSPRDVEESRMPSSA